MAWPIPPEWNIGRLFRQRFDRSSGQGKLHSREPWSRPGKSRIPRHWKLQKRFPSFLLPTRSKASARSRSSAVRSFAFPERGTFLSTQRPILLPVSLRLWFLPVFRRSNDNRTGPFRPVRRPPKRESKPKWHEGQRIAGARNVSSSLQGLGFPLFGRTCHHW